MATATRARVIEGGKIVIPAAVRRQLGIVPGDTVLLDMNNGALRVRSATQSVAHAQALVRAHVGRDVSLVNDLIADRRASADRE